MKHHHYTEEEKAWLAKQSQDLTYKQITDAFNREFNSDRTVGQISDLMSKRMKLRRTPKGQFKTGAKPKYQVGSEILKAGYLWVKVDDKYFEGKCTSTEYCENWRRKADIVWEKAHGEIPKGHFLIFLDGDKTNCSIDNLYPVTRSTHATMCKNRWYSEKAELTLLGLKWCELYQAIKQTRRER